MGKRVALSVVAVLAVSSPSAGAAPHETSQSAARVHQEHLLPVGLADSVVAATEGAAPDMLMERWPSCRIGMSINYSAGPGVSADQMRSELEYPVRYLQNLGYAAAIGNEVPYVKNAALPTGFGEVLVVATEDVSEQPWIEAFRGWAVTGNDFANVPNGLVLIDANRGLSSLVLLHELGHILGLPHKEGTVMSTKGTQSDGFDGAETAAIDCR